MQVQVRLQHRGGGGHGVATVPGVLRQGRQVGDREQPSALRNKKDAEKFEGPDEKNGKKDDDEKFNK